MFHRGAYVDEFPRSMSKLIIHSQADSLASKTQNRVKQFLKDYDYFYAPKFSRDIDETFIIQF